MVFRSALPLMLVGLSSAAAAQRPSDEAVARATAVVRSHLAERALPGVAIAVVHEDDVVLLGGYGWADREASRPMTARTRFYAGSLSKPLVAILALSMARSGEISLDAPVTSYVPSLHPAEGDASQITIRRLLTHTAALQREAAGGYWFTADFPDTTELIADVAGRELLGEPGDRWRYSNVGYAVLGHALSRAAGRPYDALLTERVLRPLGMDRSGARGPAPGDLARGYTPRGRLLPGPQRPFAGVGERFRDGRRRREYHDAGAMAPAFGMYTTAEDLARLLRFYLGHGPPAGRTALAPRQRRALYAIQHPFRQAGTGWGFGLRIGRHGGRTVARHDGWFAAHRTHLAFVPDRGLGIAVLGNADDTDPKRIADETLTVLLE